MMRRHLTALMVIGAGVLSACGDDGEPSTVQTAGVGGKAGSGSGGTTTGGAGSGTGGSVSGSAGSDETGGSGGTGGATGGTGGATGGTGGATGGAGGTAGKGGAGSGGGGMSPMLPTDDEGFTDLEESDDTVTIHVSSTDGDDGNDGLTPATAVATIDRGVSLLRDGSPDWLLFKRGDTFQGGFGTWVLSGRSPTERMVIGAYGEGERPRFEFEGSAIATHGGGDKESMDNLAWVSLNFVGTAHDLTRGAPRGDNPLCISWLRGGRDVLFEDVRFEFCQVEVQNFDGFPIERWRFFRSQFLDSFAIDDTHAQCLYLSDVQEAVVEECIFDNCGWHPDVPEATPTIFNHCVYWQEGSSPDGVLLNNIIMHGASHGAQMRASGRVEGNVFARNGIGGFLGGEFNPVPDGIQGYLVDNVFTEGEDITPREGHDGTDNRGWAWELITGIENVVMTGNIISKCLGTGCQTMPASHPGSTIEDNIVWDWTGSTDWLGVSPGPFADPDRTLATYNASLGGDESFEAFAAEVRNQSKTNWRPAYTAPTIVAYFREGFEAP